MFIKTVLLTILMIISSIFFLAETRQSTEPAAAFLEKRQAVFNVEAKIFEASEAADESRLSSKGLRQLTSWQFVSKLPVRVNTRIFLRFRLCRHLYETEESSQVAFRQFYSRETEIEEMLISKSPLFAFRNGSSVYVLYGSCQFSENNMDSMEEELCQAVLGYYPAPGNRLKIRCGGRVVR